MSDITINNKTCTGCGICTKTCPYLILELNTDLKKATVNEHAAPYCSHCGHCSAICPEGAITVTYPGAGPIPLVADSIPTVGELSRLITTRRSIRDYKDKKVPKETLEQIFDVIRYAPTGMNGQSVHWLVIQDPEEVWKFAGKIVGWAKEVLKTQPDHILAPILPMIIQAYEQGSDKVCHGAPHLVFVHGHKDNPVGFIDAIIAMTHLDIIAPVFGLGTCWAGIVQIALNSSPELMNSIGLPTDHISHYAMMIGYPKYQYHQIPHRNAAKVTWT